MGHLDSQRSLPTMRPEQTGLSLLWISYPALRFKRV